MSHEQEKREALRLLEGLEQGSMSSADIGHLVDEADPALVYLVFTWLRNRYGNDHPAAEGVIGRVVEVTNGHNSTKAKMREGKQDCISSWFEEEHSYKEFGAKEFISLVVEKLEG